MQVLVTFARIEFPADMKLLSISIITIIIFIFSTFIPLGVFAIVDPLSLPNNKFGIHITDENDLDNAANLVNSTGGDWGYVTIVIPENDRNADKWQKIFDRMKELHLIPLIRLATTMESDFWQKPKLEEAFPWADFLSQLNWVTKNRYVILFNEPNHAKEWGKSIDPKGYAEIISSYSATLKAKSDNFFILSAGLDASAPNSALTMDEENFLRKMLAANPDVLNFIDGWTSHSYPNPGFKGSITDDGRGTLKTFLWEEALLKKLGLQKKLPIFITETGWPHLDGFGYNNTYLSPDYVAILTKQAAESVWNDPSIVAITPFILNYQSYPFSNFSWQIPATDKFYPQYDAYQHVAKVKGIPILEAPPINTKIMGYQLNTSSPSPKTEVNIISSILQRLLQFISHFI